ncbi:hypothetical protein CRE_23474 [Caenorhabditis remanei]|uniref:DUF38 domain-containing protein n=1 Tax=Caenorhabditis remanei TaxID=31234 RepID=E3MGX0_CAERE|nr:hypothetical protein CRE_23474 [Caenorhabditis remanei]
MQNEETVDCEKPDSNLKSIALHVRADMIFGFTTVPLAPSQSIIHSYKKQELISIMQQGPRYAIFRKNCVDLCVDDFLWPALKHQKSLMNELSVIKNWELDKYGQRVPQNPKRLVGPKYDKVFDGLVKILESRNRTLQVKSLIVSVHGQYQLMQLLSHVDLNVLKRLEVFRLLESEKFVDTRENHSEVVLDLDILKNCKNLESLHVTRFSISSPFGMFIHIPNLYVNMQTIYCDDLLHFKHTMENSDSNAYSQILFGTISDKSRFLGTVGLAEDGRKLVHVFPSKLILTYDPA